MSDPFESPLVKKEIERMAGDIREAIDEDIIEKLLEEAEKKKVLRELLGWSANDKE